LIEAINIIEYESINTTNRIRERKDFFTVLRTELNLSKTGDQWLMSLKIGFAKSLIIET